MLILSLDLSRAVAEFSNQVSFKINQGDTKKENVNYESTLTTEEKEWIKKFDADWSKVSSAVKLGSLNTVTQKNNILVKLSERQKYIVYYNSGVLEDDWKIKLAAMMDEL